MGVGVLMIDPKKDGSGLNFPKDPIPTRASKGAVTGTLRRKEGRLWIDQNPVEPGDLQMVSDESYFLKVYQKTDKQVLVLQKTRKSGYWIKLADLEGARYRFVSWLEYMKAKPERWYIHERVRLNLRTRPDPGSKKVLLVREGRFLIDLTTKTDGRWAEVTVTEYERDPCEREGHIDDLHIVKTYRGWLKVIDDDGFPNIWFPIGC